LHENNELHRSVIKYKEDSQLHSNASLLAVQKLESENSDLKFLLNQKEKVVKNLEEDLAKLKLN